MSEKWLEAGKHYYNLLREHQKNLTRFYKEGAMKEMSDYNRYSKNKDQVDRFADNQASTRPYREPSQAVTFVYRNWNGQIRERRVVPLQFEFGSDNYHQPAQWLLHAIDIEKGARRTFAVKDILTPIRGE